MGDNDTDFFKETERATNLFWILWFASTIINLVVMLNLLIAILSSTYARVDENKDRYSYLEKAKVMRNKNWLSGGRSK